MNELIRHIQQLNEASRRKMEDNSSIFIGIFTEDPSHWADYGITTVEQFGEYLDNESKCDGRIWHRHFRSRLQYGRQP
tara:strand:- start:584 stop:817 length:234 start_codon:yes stop_codon:yes gene_type:complete